jgi:hypothetical protein
LQSKDAEVIAGVMLRIHGANAASFCENMARYFLKQGNNRVFLVWQEIKKIVSAHSDQNRTSRQSAN